MPSGFASVWETAVASDDKRSSILRFLNSPLGLWILTTVAVGLFSATFTAYQNCRNDYTTGTEKFFLLTEEIVQRRHYWLDGVANSTDSASITHVTDVVMDGGHKKFASNDFKELTFYELTRQRYYLYLKLMPKWLGEKPQPAIIAENSPGEAVNLDLPSLTDQQKLSTLRESAKTELSKDRDHRDGSYNWSIDSDCSLGRIWRRLLNLAS